MVYEAPRMISSASNKRWGRQTVKTLINSVQSPICFENLCDMASELKSGVCNYFQNQRINVLY